MAGSNDRKRGREAHYRRAAMFHPLRQSIARALAGGGELAAAELAARLEQPPRGVGHHLRVLTRRRVLKVVPRRRPTPPLYRFADDAGWAEALLVEGDE